MLITPLRELFNAAKAVMDKRKHNTLNTILIVNHIRAFAGADQIEIDDDNLSVNKDRDKQAAKEFIKQVKNNK